MIRHESLRHELAASVLSCAMDADTNPNTSRGAALNASLHALLSHERWVTGLVMPGQIPDAPLNSEVEAFHCAIDKAVELGALLSNTWDGVGFAWTSYSERYLRHLESIYTYRIDTRYVTS